MRIRVVSTGLHAPARIETAAEVEAKLGVDRGWIAAHTGVLERRVAEEPIECLAARAARAALGDGPPPDLLLYASATIRQGVPDTSVFVAAELGLAGVPSHSVHATCLSFLSALHSAASFVAVGAYRRVLIVSAEIATSSRDFDEPESAALFGDGAAAAVIEASPQGESSELLAYRFRTWPAYRDLARFEALGVRYHPAVNPPPREAALFHMDGPAIYRAALKRGAGVLGDALRAAGLGVDQIDWVVPHQASAPALAALTRFGFPKDKIVDVIARYGNCVAASIPMALAEAHADGRIQRGQHVAVLGTGAGLSLGAAVLRW